MSIARKILCLVHSITNHGNGVYSVDLEPKSSVPKFRPGQFLHLTVDPYDPSSFWPESRVFSIASSPTDRSRLRVCYSVVGKYTRHMESLLKTGSEVWAKLPFGDFEIDSREDVVLLAGGTGISAFVGFLEMLQPAHSRQVHLFYGARNHDLFLFQNVLDTQAARVQNLKVNYFSEAKIPETLTTPTDSNSIKFLNGRLDLNTVWEHVAHPESKVFYLSGPPTMLNAFKSELGQRGIPSEKIRMDAWE